MLAHLSSILLTEVMEYDTVFVDIGYEDNYAVSFVAGCLDPGDASCSQHDVMKPRVHFTLESWIDGTNLAQAMSLDIRPVLLSVLDYNVDDGYFLWREVISDALNSSDPLVLDQYESYDARFFQPHRHFDSWERVLELLPGNLSVDCSTVTKHCKAARL